MNPSKTIKGYEVLAAILYLSESHPKSIYWLQDAILNLKEDPDYKFLDIFPSNLRYSETHQVYEPYSNYLTQSFDILRQTLIISHITIYREIELSDKGKKYVENTILPNLNEKERSQMERIAEDFAGEIDLIQTT